MYCVVGIELDKVDSKALIALENHFCYRSTVLGNSDVPEANVNPGAHLAQSR